MGITNFHKMIKEKYGDSFKDKWLDFYDHVYVDLNYVLHFCSYNATNEEDVFARLYCFFDTILSELLPNKTLTVCSDGVAPLAKLVLQRQRRLSVNKSKDENAFSTMIFTPGTKFMTNLKTKLKNYFDFVKNTYCIKINYLDSEIDEAELKLKYKLMQHMKNNPDDTHIMVTNDADVVVMLTTLENPCYAFVLSRTNHKNEILSIGKMLDLHTDSVGCSVNFNYDFALISIMMGNDYLPKIRLVDFEKIWTSYKEILKVIPTGIINVENNNLKINPNFFIKLLYKLISISKQKSLNIVSIRNAFGNMYLNYLDGLTWCLHTYNTGKCVRYDYMYEYQESPHPLGLIFNIMENRELLKHNNNVSDPISSSLYAILLLPNFAKKLIDKKYHKFMEKNDILYTTEKCKECKEFYSEIQTIKNDLMVTDTETICEDTEIKINKLKKNSTELGKKLIAHKKNHDRLSLNDIKTIISNFESFN